MRATALRVVLLLFFAAPVGAIDGEMAVDEEGKQSAEFREMVIREQEKARDEYEAKVGKRRKALLRAIAREEAIRSRASSNIAASVAPVLNAEPDVTPTGPEEKRTAFYLLLFGGGVVLLLRHLSRAESLFVWKTGKRRDGKRKRKQKRVGDEPMMMTLRPRKDRYSSSRTSNL